jgi:tripartite-type tricarboxylate transporter receptor subunit TctC
MRDGQRLIRTLVIGAFALVTAPLPPTQAQEGSRQTLKIVVPFAAGGGVDVAARILAPGLGDELKQTVVIENRGGAGGMLGAQAVAQATPDGSTLLLGTGSTHGTNSSVFAKLTYDPVKDFVPVVQCTQSPLLLVVPAALPAKTFTELVAHAKGKPEPLTYASYGPGSINHLGAELMISMAGIRASHVPYRGSAPALIDLIGGRVDFMLDGISTAVGYVQAGTLRLIGVAGTRRSALLPDAPTVAEAGLPGFDTSVWFGLFAPAGTPGAVVSHLNARVNVVLASAQVKEAFAKLGLEPVGGGPEVLAARVKAEMEKWPALVRDKGIRVNP